MESKIKIFLVEDERFPLVKPLIDRVLGENNYELYFAGCMRTGVWYLMECKSRGWEFDLLLFDIKLIEETRLDSIYFQRFYEFLKENSGHGYEKSELFKQVKGVDLSLLSRDANILRKAEGIYWENGGILLWAEFLRLYNDRRWRFRSIFFSNFKTLMKQYSFLERTELVKSTDKLLGILGDDSGSESETESLFSRFRFSLIDSYSKHLLSRLLDGAMFDGLAMKACFKFHLPGGEKRLLTFKDLPRNEAALLEALKVESACDIGCEYKYDRNADLHHFYFNKKKKTDAETDMEMIASEIKNILFHYISRWQSKKHNEDCISVDPAKIDEFMERPNMIRDFNCGDIRLLGSNDNWAFKSFFSIQHQEMLTIVNDKNLTNEKKEAEIRKILLKIKQHFSRQDFAKVFGQLFKRGGVERLTHTNCFRDGRCEPHKSYAGVKFKPGEEGQKQVYLDSIKGLNKILDGISDDDLALIWGEEWKQKLSEISKHRNNIGDFSQCRQLTDWLLELGNGHYTRPPERSILRLKMGRDFLKNCIPPRDSMRICFDDSGPDNDSYVFLPQISLEGALKTVFEETLTQAQRCGNECIKFKIFIVDYEREPGRLLIGIGHDGTGGFFQSEKLSNKDSVEIGLSQINELIGVKCFRGTNGILAFENWLDFHLITKCKDKQFVRIDMFQRRTVSIDELSRFIDYQFSNYYLLFVSKAPPSEE